MSFGLMQTNNLVVKNTFLEFDLKDTNWQRRRASAGPEFMGMEKNADSDGCDTCDTETGSITGSDPNSLSSSADTTHLLDDNLSNTGDSECEQHFYCSEWDDWEFSAARVSLELESPQEQLYTPMYREHFVEQPYHADFLNTFEAYQACLKTSPHACWPQQSAFLSTTPGYEFPSQYSAVNMHTDACVYSATSSSEAPFDACHQRDATQPPQWTPSVSLERDAAQTSQWMPSVSSRKTSVNQRSERSQKTSKAEKEYTTVMLRNLPNDYTRDMLTELLESNGFGSCYDFLYMPFDFKRHAGLGYAFINMCTHKDAMRAMKALTGFCNWKLKSSKILQVSWSTPLQGLCANIERYRNSPVMHPDVPDQFKPLLLEDGSPIDFPLPTKPIPSPNLIHS